MRGYPQAVLAHWCGYDNLSNRRWFWFKLRSSFYWAYHNARYSRGTRFWFW